MQPMTILLDGDPKAPHQARLAGALQRRGHRAILMNAPEVADRARVEFGQEVEHLEVPRLWPPFLNDAWVRRRVKRLGVQVVHLNNLHPGQLIWQRLHLPYVATAWGSDLNETDFPRSDAYWERMAKLLRGSAAVTSDSTPLLERARSLAAPNTLQTELILWGVDCGRFDATRLARDVTFWRSQLGIAEHAFVVLSPRQTLPHCHPERILRGFAAMRRGPDEVLVYTQHGRAAEPAMQKQLLEEAAQLGVADRLRFAPPCPYADLPGLYAAADVAVSALEADGVASTFPELMALQVPIVASNLAAYQVIFADRRALLFEPRDPTELTAALDRLRADPALRADVARNAHRWVLQHADWERSVDAWVALYRQAIG